MLRAMLRPNLRAFRGRALAIALLVSGAFGCASIDEPEMAVVMGIPVQGRLCPDVTKQPLKVRAEPSRVFLPPCSSGAGCVTRSVNIIVDPDLCYYDRANGLLTDQLRTPVAIELDDHAVAAYVVDPAVVPDAGSGASVGLEQ